MISAEKIYVELLELYHNSGREFYDGAQFPYP